MNVKKYSKKRKRNRYILLWWSLSLSLVCFGCASIIFSVCFFFLLASFRVCTRYDGWNGSDGSRSRHTQRWRQQIWGKMWDERVLAQTEKLKNESFMMIRRWWFPISESRLQTPFNDFIFILTIFGRPNRKCHFLFGYRFDDFRWQNSKTIFVYIFSFSCYVSEWLFSFLAVFRLFFLSPPFCLIQFRSDHVHHSVKEVQNEQRNMRTK